MKRGEASLARDAESDGAVEPTGPVMHSATEAVHRDAQMARGRCFQRPVKILFVAANALRAEQLSLDEEYRTIEQCIRAGRYRDSFQLIPLLAARRGDLQHALLQHAPAVVHFACHGSADAEVVLCGDGSTAEAVSTQALAGVFRVLRSNLMLVVFNACSASHQATAICRHSGAAVGMRTRIDDRTALAFASALYGALAHGRSVRDAFDLGVAAIAAIQPAQRDAPQLFVRPGVDACELRLSAGRHKVWLASAVALIAFTASLALALRALTPADGVSDALRPQRSESEMIRQVARAGPSAPGMVRFTAQGMHSLAPAELPATCAALEEVDGCTRRAHRQQMAPAIVNPFDLDVVEVSNGDYATWLLQHINTWVVTSKGLVKSRDSNVPLVLVSEKCGGGLATTRDNRVVVNPAKAVWPVACVTWYGATEYCRAQRKRLPLDIEWELAARGRDGRLFPWGMDPPRHDGVAFDLRDGASPHPRDVGSSLQDVSPEGVRDLGGNVAEWVEDGRVLVTSKTIRGGSWASRGPCHVLGSSCKWVTLDASGPYGPDVGFRCARSVAEPQ